MTQQTVKNSEEPLIKFRCSNCGKLLAELSENAVCTIKCGRCKQLNVHKEEKKNG